MQSEPLGNRQRRRRGSHPARCVKLAAGRPQRTGEAERGQPFRPGHRIPIEHGSKQVQRRRQRRAPQLGSPADSVNKRNGQRCLQTDVAVSADAPEKRKGFPITPEQYVLSVVDELAALAVVERCRPAAKLGPRLDDDDAHALLRKRSRCAEPGETSADNDDIWGPVQVHRARRVRAQVAAAISARRGRGMRTTVEKTS